MQRHSCKSSQLLPPAHHLQHSSLGWISAGKRQHHEHRHVQHQGLHCHVSKKPGNYCFELQVTSGDPHLRGAKDITSMSAPSEHTGNCTSFTLDKGSYNPVKGLWKGLQWCKVCCENQVRISHFPPDTQIFGSYILCSNLSVPCYHFCGCSYRITKDKAAPKPLWALSLSHFSLRGAALITTDIHEDDSMCEQVTYSHHHRQPFLLWHRLAQGKSSFGKLAASHIPFQRRVINLCTELH